MNATTSHTWPDAQALPVVYHPCYSSLLLPTSHRFPIGKYHGLFQRLQASGLPLNVREPSPVSAQWLSQYHHPQYVHDIFNGGLDSKAQRMLGFPHSAELVVRSSTSVAGTLLAANWALSSGFALHLAGGYHHAHYQHGSGFCVFNDLAVTALHLQQQVLPRLGRAPRIAVLDLDVHQGDGTATMLQGQANIATFSLHGAKNFPFQKAQSTVDIALDKGCEGAAYLAVVQQLLVKVADFAPDLVLYQAGVDIHQADELGHFECDSTTLYARDRMVFDFAKQHGIAIASTLGGGYQRDLAKVVELHWLTCAAAADIWLAC